MVANGGYTALAQIEPSALAYLPRIPKAESERWDGGCKVAKDGHISPWGISGTPLNKYAGVLVSPWSSGGRVPLAAFRVQCGQKSHPQIALTIPTCQGQEPLQIHVFFSIRQIGAALRTGLPWHVVQWREAVLRGRGAGFLSPDNQMVALKRAPKIAL